jgi:hypothetical protein
MAKKDGVNKSQLIREIFEKNPKAKGKEVQQELAEKGVKVTSTLIYLVKGKLRRARRRQNRQHVAQVTGNANAIDVIRKIKAVANDVGGIQKLKQLIELLSD